MRGKRCVVSSMDGIPASDRADSSPIFAVMAHEPVFGQLARDAHAHLLAYGDAEQAVDLSIRQMLARAGVVF
jgi:hypothetical protein